MNIEVKVNTFKELMKKISSYQEALSVMYWDLRTGAPKKGVDIRSEVIGQLSTDVFEMSTSNELGTLLEELAVPEVFSTLEPVVQKSVITMKKEYDRNKVIPKKEYEEYVKLQTKAESVWEEAKETDDFNLFAPYLQQLIDYNKKFIEYWGYENHPYNALLDLYEPELTVAEVDSLFNQVREVIVPLVHSIQESSVKPKTDFLFESFPKDKQKLLNEIFLKEIGFDFDRGRLDTTVHPFQITLNINDVRITTHYLENDFGQALFGTMHECGHAMYEQNVSDEFAFTPLASGSSMAIHESQSLFFENIIGRNKNFWEKYYPLLQENGPESIKNVSLDEYYRAINNSVPSFIRIHADELTYPLHIIVRYEIEKGIFEGLYKVEDLPKIWNEKMTELLGVTPRNNTEGILQDVHWSGGSFGYFPSYALGFMYSAQFYNTMKKEIPVEQLMREGKVQEIREWLTKNIHQYGKSKTPKEIVQDVTGEPLNAQYLIDFLKEKYEYLYEL